jgi:hypothetical protein
VLVFNERHEVHVVLATDDEDALTEVTVWVRMFQDLEHLSQPT